MSIGFSGNIASSAINAQAIEQANQANIQAQKELNKQNRLAHSRANRKGRVQSIVDKKYATYMSNTAVSRKMQDMINAGLNPMALGSEASAGASSSPVGHSSRSVANLGRADIKAKNTMNLSGGVLDIMSGIAGIENTKAQTSNLVANDNKLNSEAASAQAQADYDNMVNDALKSGLDNPATKYATQKSLIASKIGGIPGAFGAGANIIGDVGGGVASALSWFEKNAGLDKYSRKVENFFRR